MQFIDLKKQQQRIRSEIEERIRKILDHGIYVMGPEITELEEKLKAYCGMPYALAVGSGTEALYLPLLALGIGPGDAVFTSSFTFIATAEVVSLAGATPVFVDIEEESYNICPEKLEAAIVRTFGEKRLRPRGIIAVDIFGQAADYGRIAAIAEKYGLFLIEDAAQSFGAEYHGRKSCSLAPVAATSFFPAKPLGAYGDAGMIFCRDEKLWQTLVSLRIHGQGEDKYHNDRIGINGRMDTMQAAILLAKFGIFDDELRLRQDVAARYEKLLRPLVTTPVVAGHNLSSWAQYCVRHPKRELLMEELKKKAVPTAIYYPIPLHLQQAFASLGYSRGDLPVTEKVSSEIFALPFHPYLEGADQEMIAATIAAALK
jgi:dTDP-4-amino-4,6-dideoxygalactose transaminase